MLFMVIERHRDNDMVAGHGVTFEILPVISRADTRNVVELLM